MGYPGARASHGWVPQSRGPFSGQRGGKGKAQEPWLLSKFLLPLPPMWKMGEERMPPNCSFRPAAAKLLLKLLLLHPFLQRGHHSLHAAAIP